MSALQFDGHCKRQIASGVGTLFSLSVYFVLITGFCVSSSSSEDKSLRYLNKIIDLKLDATGLHQRRHPVKRDVGGITHLPPPSPSSPPSPSPSAPSSTRSSASSPHCPISCRGVKQRVVCASDGFTYSSKCEIRRLRECEAKELKVISKGRCPDETKCQEERRLARYELVQRPGQDIYIPECKSDGSYMETQCHDGTGYCWCVRSDGKPIAGSSVEGQNTNCQKTTTTTTINGKKKQQSSVGSKHRRGVGGCSPNARSFFNQNLIRRFSEEYARAPKPIQQTTAALSKAVAGGGVTVGELCQGDVAAADSCVNRRIIEWKFSELDIDKDEELKRKELKTLKYLVNKIVEPHACALSFLEYCDWDNNKRIALSEWTKCLRVPQPTTNTNSTIQQPTNPKKKGETKTKTKTKTIPRKQFGSDRLLPRVKPGPSKALRVPSRGISLSQRRIQPRIPLKPLKATFYDLKSRTKETVNTENTRSKYHENEEKNSQQGTTDVFRLRPCDDERQKAKEMDRADPEGHIFIPECESNGSFRKAQCHNSTGYCWCVDEKTGIPIPGISTHNVTPDCSEVKTNSLKGCPFLTKKRFLEELLDHITQEMVDRANNETSSVSQLNKPDPSQSIEERAVRWKLSTMDSNHNGILEKGEVKNFREEIKLLTGEEKYMRKCRRNFLQYCDEDNDSKITLDEWVNCLGLNEQQKNLPENPKRIGKNPFSTVLKS